MGCEECRHEKENVSKRLNSLEKNAAIQEMQTRSTNDLLSKIDNTLTRVFDELRKDLKVHQADINELKLKIAIENNETKHSEKKEDVKREFNYKAVGALITLVGLFATIVSSIISA